MSVHTIAHARLFNAEALTFYKSSLVFVEANPAIKTALDPEIQVLHGPVAVMETLFRPDTTAPLTAGLEMLDFTRDSYLRGIAQVAGGHTLNPDPTVKDGALALLHILDVYGGAEAIARQSYSAQSASVDNLITDWNSNAVVSAGLPGLALSNWISDLKMVNLNFHTQYNQRTIDTAAQATDDTMKEQRVLAAAAWRNLIRALEYNESRATNKTPWQTVMNQLNELIDQNNITLAARAARAKAAKKDGGTTPTA